MCNTLFTFLALGLVTSAFSIGSTATWFGLSVAFDTSTCPSTDITINDMQFFANIGSCVRQSGAKSVARNHQDACSWTTTLSSAGALKFEWFSGCDCTGQSLMVINTTCGATCDEHTHETQPEYWTARCSYGDGQACTDTEPCGEDLICVDDNRDQCEGGTTCPKVCADASVACGSSSTCPSGSLCFDGFCAQLRNDGCQNSAEDFTCDSLAGAGACSLTFEDGTKFRDRCPLSCGCCDVDGECACNQDSHVHAVASKFYLGSAINSCEDVFRTLRVTCGGSDWLSRMATKFCPCMC